MFALYGPLSLDTLEILTIGFVQYFDEALKVSQLLYLGFPLCMLNPKSLYDFSLEKCFHFVPVLKTCICHE